MKIILNTLFATISLINICWSQEYNALVTYKASLNSEEFYNRLIQNENIDEARKNVQLDLLNAEFPINFLLLIKGSESLFIAEQSLEEKVQSGLGMNRTGMVARDFNTYYRNIKTGENFYQCYFTKDILVQLSEIKWEITKETKKIGEYICYKAIGNTNEKQVYGYGYLEPTIAWFSPEIPIPFGLQNFHGLPGLILELTVNHQDGIVLYEAIKIELNSTDKIKIRKPVGRKMIPEGEYAELIEKLNGNRSY